MKIDVVELGADRVRLTVEVPVDELDTLTRANSTTSGRENDGIALGGGLDQAVADEVAGALRAHAVTPRGRPVIERVRRIDGAALTITVMVPH